MKKNYLSLLFLVLFLVPGIGLSETTQTDEPQVSIAYTTNTWGQIEPVHS